MEYVELRRHGYRKGLTSTEYALDIVNILLKTVNDEKEFIRTYYVVVDKVLRERPSNMASVNLLRDIGSYLLKNGFSGIRDYIVGLIDRIEKACEETAIIASHRIVEKDVLMTLSDSLCVRKMFKHLVDKGVEFEVYVLESRPGMEGLDLADYLDKLGVKTNLIIDSAARFFVKNVKKVVVGVEALAVNGAVVGKIGTSLLSLVANEARVRVFALAPLYKLSFETIYGELLELPEGDWSYLMDEEVRKTLPQNYSARVPVFDVTPPHLIDGIVTEYGLFAPQAIPVVLKQIYGVYPPKVESLEHIVSQIKEKWGEIR